MTTQIPITSIPPKNAMKIHKGTTLGISIRDWLTYTNVAYLLSLLLTFALTATLWRVSVSAQNEADNELDRYKKGAELSIAQANERVELARRDAALARLETEKLKSTLQWRILDTETKARLRTALQASSNKHIHIALVFGDPESIWLGQQFAAEFASAGWSLTAQAVPLTDTIATGISIPREPHEYNDELRGIFSSVGIPVGDYNTPVPGISMGAGVRWPPKTGQLVKRESSMGAASWPEVRLVEYTEETQCKFQGEGGTGHDPRRWHNC